MNVLSLLGKHQADANVLHFMRSIGLEDKKIKLKRGESVVALESEKSGVDINFCDPSDVLVADKFPDGALVVSAIFLYDQGVQGHVRYAGELPHALQFGETRDLVKKRLGSPVWSSPALPIDRWSFENHDLTIWFDKASNLLIYAIVHLKKR